MFASSTQWLNPSIRLAFFLLVTAVVGSGVALGQTQSNAADLQGVVRDQSGAVVNGATVMARNVGTNTSKTTTTNEEGGYLIVNLAPREYEGTVEAANFKKSVLPGGKLTRGQQAELDTALEVGQVRGGVTAS